MQGRIAEALGLKHSPVAVVLTDAKPDGAIQFKEGTRGCLGAMLLAAAKGRAAAFDRGTFGCPGGGTGLGFGNCYIDRELLSYTVPYRMFIEMEGNVERSFLATRAWQKLRERWQG